ncbi:MAG: hypothetical protein EON85_08915 [Brevundimonas sp.]|nr:MAG: hypothetical protein EON85_08915 [Brevundimonas sp.]
MQLVTEICYTAKDYNQALEYWLDLGFEPLPSPLTPVADITLYERKDGAQKQLAETYTGGPVFVLHFAKK